MEIERLVEESQNPRCRVEAELSGLRLDHKPSKEKEAVVAEDEEEEGRLLLDLPTFSDMGNGRLRCVATGHELLSRDKDAYSRSKACRLALIDAAVAAKKPPLNVFQPHPTSKSRLLCQLTGDIVNKTEKHIWKHINGKRFLNKLEQKEMEKLSPIKVVEKDNKFSEKQQKTVFTPCKKEQEKHADEDEYLSKKIDTQSNDMQEPDFWVPPIGSRWDYDDGKDRWDSCENLHDEKDDNGGPDEMNKLDDSQTGEQPKRIKRTSKAVGPSSFASRKKKLKKNNKNLQ